MIPPPIPENEAERLQALLRLQLLDTPRERLFDTCVRVAGAIVGASRGAVSLVDRERQWFKAVFGELPPETARDVSFCGHAVAQDATLIVPDARSDPRFADNPLVTEGGIRFYAGFPLRSHEGHPIGTLCVIHDQPLQIDADQAAALTGLSECISTHLDLRLLALRLGAAGFTSAEQQRRLAQLERQRQEILAMTAHDLRNPLAVALGTAEVVLVQKDLPQPVREAAEAIISATQAASRLLNELVSVARSGASSLQARFQPTDVLQIAQALVVRLRLLAQRNGQQIEIECRTGRHLVHGDGLLLERMLRNLLDNAMKYAGPGQITVRLRDGGPDQMVVEVADTGAQVPAELRQQVFEPGFRSPTAAAQSGQGLGLAFCRDAVELHGGSIALETPAAGGNVFVVTLPLRPVSSTAPV